ncbi:hypothetical protein CF326_g9775 [Tilletia indica]|nr:hypothetical protein CF326_g9775 [Tilletia indica]
MKAQAHQKEHADKRRTDFHFDVGDLVLLSTENIKTKVEHGVSPGVAFPELRDYPGTHSGGARSAEWDFKNLLRGRQNSRSTE